MDTEIKSKRGGWGSNFGFLMASIGSAVGLGNIWGFPYKMGKSGGAVFLLFYLVLVVLVGVTVMLGELALGRRSGKSGVSTYRALSKKYTWLGYAGVLCGFCIMCFYFVLGGIVLRYTVGYFLSLFGGSEFAWSGQGTDFFGYFLTDTKSMILFFVLYILLNIIVVSGGVHGGIEKFCNIGMPALFCLLVFIIAYIACQPGAAEGYRYLLIPQWEKLLDPMTWVMAMGQAFFSLSITGSGMIIYGSYLSKKEDIPRAAMQTALLDTCAALLAGFAILPAVFAFGMDPASGPPLIFITLPKVFAQMPGGRFIAVLFFLSVIFAGITSLINMFEVCAEAVTTHLKLPRKAAVVLVGALAFAAGAFIEFEPYLGKWMDAITIYVVPFGALLCAFIIYWVLGGKRIGEELVMGRKKALCRAFLPTARYLYVGLAVLVFILSIICGGIG